MILLFLNFLPFLITQTCNPIQKSFENVSLIGCSDDNHSKNSNCLVKCKDNHRPIRESQKNNKQLS